MSRRSGSGSGAAAGAKVDWAPAQRGAGTVGVTVAGKLADEQADAEVDADTDTDADVDTSEPERTEVEPAAGGSGDSELDALLADLGADDAAADTPVDAVAGDAEPEMDADLVALLASLG